MDDERDGERGGASTERAPDPLTMQVKSMGNWDAIPRLIQTRLLYFLFASVAPDALIAATSSVV
jgi:hypothetical protein